MARPLIALLTFLCLSVSALSQGGQKMTPKLVKTLIQQGTQVEACSDPLYSCESVQIAPAERQREGGRSYEVHPVHARFLVTCRVDDEKMRVEIDLRDGYYLDEFGAWKSTDPGFEGNQSWNNTQSDVRCRAQNLAHLTFDKDGKVTSGTPAKDQSFGFPACRLLAKASD